MVVGYVLITALPKHEHQVYNRLTKVQEIIEINPLFGEYDLIAKIKAEDSDKLANIVVNKIRSIDGVSDTYTLTGTKF